MSGCTCDHFPHKDGCPYVHENPVASGETQDPFAGCFWRDDRGVEVMNVSQARAILAARLADANARLAAVEALAEEWRRGPGPNPRWLNALETALAEI